MDSRDCSSKPNPLSFGTVYLKKRIPAVHDCVRKREKEDLHAKYKSIHISVGAGGVATPTIAICVITSESIRANLLVVGRIMTYSILCYY